jgi:hypothetical protein
MRQLSRTPFAYFQVISAGTKYVRINVRSLTTDDQNLSIQHNARISGSCSGSSSSSSSSLAPPKQQLLCTVRALLKKMQQTVLVGDEVTISSIDWAAGRGTVSAVLPRTSELVDPAIANVDHVVLLFGLTKPPVSLCWRCRRGCQIVLYAVFSLGQSCSIQYHLGAPSDIRQGIDHSMRCTTSSPHIEVPQ